MGIYIYIYMHIAEWYDVMPERRCHRLQTSISQTKLFDSIEGGLTGEYVLS